MTPRNLKRVALIASIFPLLLGGCAGFVKSDTPPTQETQASNQKVQPEVKPEEKSKPISRKIGGKQFNCDPVFVSGITGDCTGTGDPAGFAGEDFRAGLAPHPQALDDLPKDRFGLVDWADAIKSGVIQPFHSFNPKDPDSPQIDMDVVIFTKSKTQPDVIFPHKVHEMWLTCTNCHPSIFPMNAKEANRVMTMPEIAAGQFCGRCHNRIAFPLTDCLRCHVKPRDVPPIDPDADKWQIRQMAIPDISPVSTVSEQPNPTVTIATIEIFPKAYSLNPCEKRVYAASVKDKDSQSIPDPKITWQSTHPAVAKIDDKGVAVGVGPGFAFIRAIHGNVKSNVATLVVRDKGIVPNC